ncbi:MAG: TonB-dependent siderophore receptor [Vicinamibacterales bacterium]
MSVLMVALSVWAATSAPVVAAQPALTISGVVKDSDGGVVPGARVSLDGQDAVATTDGSGAYSLPVPAAGRYTVRAAFPGVADGTRSVEVTAAMTGVDIDLGPLVASEAVMVVGRTVGDLGLNGSPTTASRLGLRALDIPASIDVLDSRVMDARGYQKVSDAVGRMAGVVSGEHPTAPSSFTMRGFTASQVATLRDGIWLGPSTMVMRPQNTFNLERIELLRGPSSVVNGQGSVAGAINAVTKSAEPTATTRGNALFSYGQFNTYHAAAGVTGPIADTLWYRADVSRSGSDGYVDRMDSGSTNLTASLLWRPVPRVRVKLSADYLDDDLAKYFGTPLVPQSAAVEPLDVLRTTTGETIDGRTRFVNYNVDDGVARADQTLLRADVAWDLASGVTLTNVAYGFDAERRWQNAEGYVYCAAVVDVCRTVGEIQRYYGYFLINHDQRLYGDRLTVNVDRPIGGRANSLVVGTEVSALDFERTRGFRRQVPLAPGDAVDLLAPVPGSYGPLELRGISPTFIDAWAVFLEDSLAVTDRLRVTGAVRYDGLDLDRQNLSPTRVPEAGGFTRAFTWWSWRAGSVVTLQPGLVAYGQFSTAKDPVSSNIFLVNANQNFDLTSTTQWEVGAKADLQGGRTQLTAAYFDVRRDDVLDRFALDSVTSIGGITSRGVELGAAVQAGANARVGANFGYTDATFRSSANFQRFAGNRAPNVPKATANLWASYQNIAGRPLEVGGSARYVGERYANNANLIAMKGYGVGDVYAAWTQGRLRVTARVDNVTDAVYAAWSDPFYVSQVDPSFLYANQLMLGAPRTASVQLQIGF